MKVAFSSRFGTGRFNPFGSGKNLQPLGFVEEIGADVVTGWAFHPKDARLVLRLKVGEEIVDLQPQWVERLDVAASHGMRAMKSGFVFVPDKDISERLAAALENEVAIEVLANNLTLPTYRDPRKTRREHAWAAERVSEVIENHNVVSEMPAEVSVLVEDSRGDQEKQLRWQPLDISIENAKVSACIESWGGFSIRGWAALSGAAPQALSIVVAGDAYPIDAVWRDRGDIAKRLGTQTLRIGFELDLPGYLWQTIEHGKELSVSLLGDGELLNPYPLILTREQAADWIDELCQLPETQDLQYRMLLAMEHLHFGLLAQLLQSASRASLRSFAERMHLGEHRRSLEEESAQKAPEVVPEDVNSLLLWAVMRELNAALVEADSANFSLIRDNSSWRNLPDQAKEWYLNLAVQLTCESNEFLRLRELTDLHLFQKFEWSEEPSQLTLALPALVANQHIARATDLMWRLAKKVNSGWIYTENLRFAVSHIQELERTGEADPVLAEKFRYSFIWLLDSYKGEWFSRLHDGHLIEALISVLDEMERYTDSHKRDVVSAAIRHYGLCPTFWHRLAAHLPALDDHDLLRARDIWTKLQTVLEESLQEQVKQLPTMLECLEYFRANGNPEVPIYLREIVANHLERLNRAPCAVGDALVKALNGTDFAEPLRVAAYPLTGSNQIARRLPETSAQFPRIVRQLMDGPKSPVYEMQMSAAQALQNGQLFARDKKRAELRMALERLERFAVSLASWQGGFLSADLLATAYLLAANAGLDEKRFLMRLAQVVRKVTFETNLDYYIPASVFAALSRLVALPRNPILQSFLSEAQNVIEGKFGSRHGNLFHAKPAPRHFSSQLGWPTDTLVVIDSSEERLDTYVAAVRTSWMRDLKARGIPYLVAIEGMEDKLDGDVLTLGLDGGLASKSRKTLRLLEWVYRQTEAQFIVRIEDDCYLNVDRFFDTLTYRKHIYSGRVIRRGAGEFERGAHQARAQYAHARYSLDKSPEGSVYADGAGAICLSRIAVHKLLESSATESGARLVSASFHEDKLIGDLLALSNIYPSNEDCEHVHRQRTFETAVPVAFQENAFFPSLHAPAKVVHLDRAQDIALISEQAGNAELWPKKIWASCWPPSIKANSNQLELLSPVTKVHALLEQEVVLVAVVRNEMIMLPHFLEHYRRLGVGCFFFVDNCSDDGSREFLLEQADVVVYSAETAYKHSHYGVTWQQAVMANHCLGKWVILADADEFLVFEDCERKSLSQFTKEIAGGGYDGVFVHMIDMYPFGDLSDACFEKGAPFEVAPFFDRHAQVELKFGGGQFSNSRNFVNGLRHRLAPSRINSYVSQKYALFRYSPWIRLTEGIHYSANMKVAQQPAFFAHFKYHAGFKNKVLTEIKRNQHYNGAEEYRRYAGMLAEGKGSFGDPAYTVRYQDSRSFVELFK